MKLIQVPKHCIDDVWPRVRKWLVAALDKGDRWWDEETLRHDVEHDPRAQLWLCHTDDGIQAAAVTLLEDKPNGERVAHFPAMGGERLKEWVHPIMDELEEWCRDQGATSMHIIGRKGWRKIMTRRGYVEPLVHLEKAL